MIARVNISRNIDTIFTWKVERFLVEHDTCDLNYRRRKDWNICIVHGTEFDKCRTLRIVFIGLSSMN